MIKKRLTVFFIVTALLTLLPLLYIIISYNIPVRLRPYYIDLTGKWGIREGSFSLISGPGPRSNMTIVLPGSFRRQGYDFTNFILQKQFVLKDKMSERTFIL